MTTAIRKKCAKALAGISLIAMLSSLGIYQVALAALEKQWPSNASPSDIVISNNPPTEDNQHVVRASDGDYIVTFLLNGRPYAYKISATDGSAVAAWNGGFPTIASTNVGAPVAIAADNSGGAYVALNIDQGGGNCDVIVQRLDSTGTVQYGGGGVNITTGSGCEAFMQMIPDGSGGIYLAWGNGGPNTNTFQSTDLYITRMDSAGTVNASWNTGGSGTWRPAQFPESQGGGTSEHSAHIVADGLGNVVAIYESSVPSFYFAATKFDANGNLAGAPWNTPLEIDADNNGNLGRHLISDGSGNVYIGFLAGNFGSPDNIQVQKLNSAGTAQWGTGVTVTSTDVSSFAGNPRIVEDGSGGVIVAWQTAGADFEIYSHHVTSAGSLDTANNWASAPIALSNTTQDTSWFQTSDRQSALSDGAGGAYVLYGSYEGGAYAVSKLQHIESDGSVEFTGDGTTLGVGAGIEGVQAVMTSDGGTGVVTVFQDEDATFNLDLYAQYFDEVAGGGGGGGSNTDQTGMLDIECGDAPAFTAVPATTFNFTADGNQSITPGVNDIVASGSAQEAFSDDSGNLENDAGVDRYLQVSDGRDPAEPTCNNDGITVDVRIIADPTNTDGDNRLFETDPTINADPYIDLDDLYVLSAVGSTGQTCPAGTAVGSGSNNGICFATNSLCGTGDNSALVTCDGTNGGSAPLNYTTDTAFDQIATFTGSGSALGTSGGSDIATPVVVLSFSDGSELLGEAGLATAFGLVIDAAQQAGTYEANLQYTLNVL